MTTGPKAAGDVRGAGALREENSWLTCDARQHATVARDPAVAAARGESLLPLLLYVMGCCSPMLAWVDADASRRRRIAVLLYPLSTHVPFLGGRRTHTESSRQDVDLIEQIQRPLVAALTFRASLDAMTAVLRNDHEGAAPGVVGSALVPAAALSADYHPT